MADFNTPSRSALRARRASMFAIGETSSLRSSSPINDHTNEFPTLSSYYFSENRPRALADILGLLHTTDAEIMGSTIGSAMVSREPTIADRPLTSSTITSRHRATSTPLLMQYTSSSHVHQTVHVENREREHIQQLDIDDVKEALKVGPAPFIRPLGQNMVPRRERLVFYPRPPSIMRRIYDARQRVSRLSGRTIRPDEGPTPDDIGFYVVYHHFILNNVQGLHQTEENNVLIYILLRELDDNQISLYRQAAINLLLAEIGNPKQISPQMGHNPKARATECLTLLKQLKEQGTDVQDRTFVAMLEERAKDVELMWEEWYATKFKREVVPVLMGGGKVGGEYGVLKRFLRRLWGVNEGDDFQGFYVDHVKK